MNAVSRITAPTLPGLKGRAARDAPLGPQTWFRVGGPADWLVRPADLDDLLRLLRRADAPITVIGAASNLIIRDGGVRGIVVRLARGFSDIVVDGDGVIAGAGALDLTVAERAASASLTGLEYLSGIPGTVGGAVAMNAGAYGTETRDVLDWAEIATADGLLRVTADDLRMTYRHASLPPGGIIVRARFRAAPGNIADIVGRMADVRARREATQPVRSRTGGSTFRNPADAPGGAKAWQLIEAAGLRGLTRGGAQVSEKHCNFLLNTGEATAADLEDLGEEVRAKVLAQSGIALHWEIRRIGDARP